MKFICSLTCFLLVLSCESDDKKIIDPIDISEIEAQGGDILINEISSNSSLDNEFGKASDWLELYNNNSSELILKNGDWTLSDDSTSTDKFEIPEVKIAPHGFLLVWCDKAKEVGKEIHTNFKISSKDETISLYFRGALVDEIHIDSTKTSLSSWARVRDGDAVWHETAKSSPNKSNN